jgi:hypothetical protein
MAITSPRPRRKKQDTEASISSKNGKAEALGWRADELFGLHRDAPMGRYDRMGLIWMLNGESVIAFTTTTARLSSGLTFYRNGSV